MCQHAPCVQVCLQSLTMAGHAPSIMSVSVGSNESKFSCMSIRPNTFSGALQSATKQGQGQGHRWGDLMIKVRVTIEMSVSSVRNATQAALRSHAAAYKSVPALRSWHS